MSLWTSIRNAVTGVIKPIVGIATTAVGSFLGGPVGGAVGGAIGGTLTGSSTNTAPPTTAGAQAGGLVQTLPALRMGAPVSGLGATSNSPTAAGGMMQSLASQAGTFLRAQVLGGASAVGGGMSKTKVGKLTGNMIPRGYIERMSPAGVIYLAKAKHRRGITARDLSAYRRVDRLVHRIAHHTTRRRSK